VTDVDAARTAPPVPETAPAPHEPVPGDPPRGRRGLVWLGLGGAVVVAAATGIWLWVADSSPDAVPATTGPEATAIVEVGTVSATERWDGRLGRGTPFTVRSGAAGTITRLADPGAPVGGGDVLFRVDEQPVTLLSGVVPMYRDLGPGASGPDVAQLEDNLAALGYLGFAADDRYSSSTVDAVRVWQQEIGAAATGMVARGDVIFAPGGGQVATLRFRIGDVVAPGTPVLDIAGTDQVVNLEVDVGDLDRFDVGAEVTVLLPGGDEVPGTVSAATVVEAALASPEAMSGEGDAATDPAPIVEIDIALDGNAPDQLVGVPVEVVVRVDERTDVLLVPVNALLARAEGGYALEVVADDGTTSIVPVETGLFGAGKVEVTSADIDEGTVVGVAGR
jgi:peptidoglycan hydrolase-like protein with peptidoglycan-binding domain